MTSERSVYAIIASIVLLVVARPSAAQEEPERRPLATAATRIEAVVAPQAEAELLSGVILVARGDQILFHRGYGFADWELDVPVSRSTRFGIASITKPMTEVVVDLLAREGRIDLDAPVERYLPGFPRGPDGDVATVRHLLTHRSGVPHRVTDVVEETQPLRAADIVERVRDLGLRFEPGAERLYSSAGFTCLARVIEVVEGESFEVVLAERVFRPADMSSAMSETGPGLMAGRAMPYRLGADDRRVVVKRAPYKDLRFLTGAGSVYATAEDLLRFVRAIQGGVFGEELSAEAFGGDRDTWHGWTGRTGGYEASLDVLPAEDLVFVFLSNLRSAANWRIRERVRGILVGDVASTIPFPPPVAPPFEEPASLLGSYGPAEIELVDGALFRGGNEFYPIDGERYYIPASGTVMRFRRDSTGAVNGLVSIGGGGRESVLARSMGGER